MLILTIHIKKLNISNNYIFLASNQIVRSYWIPILFYFVFSGMKLDEMGCYWDGIGIRWNITRCHCYLLMYAVKQVNLGYINKVYSQQAHFPP